MSSRGELLRRCARAVVVLGILAQGRAAWAQKATTKCTFTSLPTDASIYVDGSDRAAGKTPFTVPLERTGHTVRLEADGYTAKEFTITVGTTCVFTFVLQKQTTLDVMPLDLVRPDPATPDPVPNPGRPYPIAVQRTDGVYLSTDGGVTWTLVPGANKDPGQKPDPPRELPPPVRTLTSEPGKGVAILLEKRVRSPFSLGGLFQFRDTATKRVGETLSEVSNVAVIARARLFLDGYLGSPKITYLVIVGWGATDLVDGTLLPAFLTFRHHRDLNVQVGQFRTFVDRQTLDVPFVFQTIERAAMVKELGATFDVGVQLHSNDLFGLNRLAYRFFIGTGDGANQQVVTPQGYDGHVEFGLMYLGRVEFSPFGQFDDDIEGDFDRTTLPRLAIGLGAAYNHRAQRDHGNVGSFYTLGGFNYLHGAADVTFKYAGLSAIAEVLVRRSSELKRTDLEEDDILPVMGLATGKTEWSRSALGYMLQAGYMTERFVELVVRYDRLVKIRQTQPSLEREIRERGQELGGAVNWYMFRNHGFKLQAEYFYQFGEVWRTGLHTTRLQLQASF